MNGAVESNLAAVIRALSDLPDALSPRRRPVGGRRLGDEYADTVAEAVRYRTVVEQRDPDGAPLPRLNPRYLRRKLTAGYDGRILVRTGEMTEHRQLRGRVTVTADRVVMTAGLDDAVNRRAGYNTRGDARRNRPPRRFYESGRAGARAVLVVGREAVASAVRRAREG